MNRDHITSMSALPLRAFAVLLATGLGFAMPASLGAQGAAPKFTNLIENNMGRCAPGAGPAVRVDVSGIKSADGIVIVRAYHARENEWLKAKKYFAKVHEPARKGQMSVCIPVPAAGGQYAIAVQHDVKGNYSTNFSTDGAGMSNNPVVKTFIGIPRPPAVEQVAFAAGSGVTRVAIEMRYRN
jgi:uncharacterized protein (DUF2141 family)